MPQDASNNYKYPDGTRGIPDQTIESEAYNTFLDDLVVNDLNIARPIHRGGTNATTAVSARDNLDVEVAGALVTNYDSHVWEAGSFSSAIGATAAPTSTEKYQGLSTVIDADNATIEAWTFGATPGKKYARQKVAGVWSAWAEQAGAIADTDVRYVNVAGDTMTGNLTVDAISPRLILDREGDTGEAGIVGGKGGAFRWFISLGAGAETANAGSDFGIYRYNDAGTPISAFGMYRGTGHATFGSNLTVQGVLTVSNGPSTITGNTTVNGNLYTVGGAVATGTPTTGNIYFGQNLQRYMGWDGATFFCNGGFNVGGGSGALVSGTGTFTGLVSARGAMELRAPGGDNYLTFYDDTAGATGSQITRYFSQGIQRWQHLNVGPYPHLLQCWRITDAASAIQTFSWDRATGTFAIGSSDAYKPGGGAWLDSSDIRIKNVLGDYTHGLAELKQLLPKRFTYKGNDAPPLPPGVTLEQFKAQLQVGSASVERSTHYQVATDAKEFVGLVAQDCETAMPELVTLANGMIDGQPVTDLRQLDTTPLIFALINAVKELAARVEQLEGI